MTSLRRYARAMLRNRNDADDLVQDTLVRALAQAEKFASGTNLRAWLFTIMHNLHVNRLRQNASRPNMVAVEDAEAKLVEPARQEARVELREMSRAVDSLPEDQRQVLLLVALEGLKYDEAAGVLGVPIGTVMSRLSRAREAVRKALAAGGGPAVLRVVR
ncbi:MAG: sigma-70 family RNA polymerase sigma factor [Azospirillum sp.]|nr:sigma-70 family RNA polymerase sigma factor [Azospirillum sp.]